VRHPDSGEEIFGLSMRRAKPGRRYGRLYATRDRNRTFGTPRDDDELRTSIARFRAACGPDGSPALLVRIAGVSEARSGEGLFDDGSADLVMARDRLLTQGSDGVIRVMPVGLLREADAWKYARHTRAYTEPEYWLEVGRLIRRDPREWAARLGVREIGYLPELKPPARRIGLERVGALYQAEKAGRISAKERARCAVYWEEFCAGVRPATTVQELTKANLEGYAELVRKDQTAKECADSYVRGRFLSVRTVFNYAFEDPDLDIPPGEVARLKRLFKRLLKPPRQPRGNAVLVTPGQLLKLLNAAEAIEDRCLVLLALNGAYYPKDLTELRFDQHVDLNQGGVSFRRAKTGMVQVCRLWERTHEALLGWREEHPDWSHVFMFAGHPVHRYTLAQHFVRLCKVAQVEGVTMENLRDSAVTVAARSASSAQYQALMGHQVGRGADDNYIARNYEFVTDACAAIHRYYFGSEPW
jgi:hypothetical protein